MSAGQLEQTTVTVNKIILLATGAPGGSDIRDYLVGLYEENGDWIEVAAVIDDYMNTLLAESDAGIPGLIQAMAKQALGVQLSLAEAEAVTNDFIANGIDSWSGLFAWLMDNTATELNTVWDNRAQSADEFTDLLDSLNKRDDYSGAQALAAAREWVDGIGASDASMAAARQSASELITRFVDGKVKGTAIDGYVAGATVFIDVNGNGVLDADEPFTISDANGDYIFAEDSLPGGSLVGSGGTDLATGQPFEGRLTAPGGSSVLSPLTTLVQQMQVNEPGRSQADIEDAIFITLGIPRVDLSSYDPIRAGLDSTSSREAQVNAAKIQAATSQLVNVMSVSAAVNEKLAPGTGAANNAIAALASAVQQASAQGRVISLSDAQTVADVVKAAAQNAGVGSDQAVSLDQLSTEAGQTMQGVNGKTQQSVDALASNASASVVGALSDIYKLQKLTQTEVSPDIRSSDASSLQSLSDRYSGSNLDTAVSTVQAGNLNADTPTNSGNVTRPAPPPAPEPEIIAPPAAPTLALTEDNGALTNDQITNYGFVTVTGLVGGSWEYSLDGDNWLPGKDSSVDAEGSGDGAKTVSARQTDSAGNTSTVSSVSFTLDTTVPGSPTVKLVASAGNVEVEEGEAPYIVKVEKQLTNDRTVLISGLEDGATWEFRGGGYTGSWQAGTGNSLELDGVDGVKDLQVRQIDLAGNIQSMWKDLNVILDTTAPAALGVALHQDTGSSTSDGITYNDQVDFTLTALEDNASWQYSLDGETWTASSISSISVEGDGAKKVSVRQTDQAGNVGAASSVSFTLDTVAPIVTAAPALTSDTTISVQANEAMTAGLYLRSNDTLIGDASIIAANTAGSITVGEQSSVTDAYIRMTDAAGNGRVATKFGTSADIRVTLGTKGDDTITGVDGSANIILSYGGNDVITGGNGTDIITGGLGADTINGGAGKDLYIYLSVLDSSVLNVPGSPTDLDHVTVTYGDIFEYAPLAIESVTSKMYNFGGQAPKTESDELLAQLNGYFFNATGGTSTGVHAMVVNINNEQKFLMIDVDANQLITQDDLVVRIDEESGFIGHSTELTLIGSNVSFVFTDIGP